MNTDDFFYIRRIFMKQTELNMVYTSEMTVSEEHLACSVGSGEARVLSTPSLIALMENAAMNCAAPFLDEGETTVGTYIAAEHTSATPAGMKCFAKATLTGQNGRELCFEVLAYDEAGEIGKAKHRRFALNAAKFQSKADGKSCK